MSRFIQQRLYDLSHVHRYFVFLFMPPRPRVGKVTFLRCRVTAERYFSHGAQMPCVTTAFLLAAGIGCSALLPNPHGVKESWVFYPRAFSVQRI
jgi:hypothetical protein